MTLLRLDVKAGHLKWKVTDLSRQSKTSRSRVYEILGSSKKSMLLTALKFVLEDIYGLSDERMKMPQGKWEGILHSRQSVMQFPELLSFYFRQREKKDEAGSLIKTYEEKYLQLVAEQTGVTDPQALLFLRTIIHGIGVAPYLTDKQAIRCLEQFDGLVKGSFKESRHK